MRLQESRDGYRKDGHRSGCGHRGAAGERAWGGYGGGDIATVDGNRIKVTELRRRPQREPRVEVRVNGSHYRVRVGDICL